jgi:hypothetical protein
LQNFEEVGVVEGRILRAQVETGVWVLSLGPARSSTNLGGVVQPVGRCMSNVLANFLGAWGLMK